MIARHCRTTCSIRAGRADARRALFDLHLSSHPLIGIGLMRGPGANVLGDGVLTVGLLHEQLRLDILRSCARVRARYSVPTTLIDTHVHLVNHGGRLQVVNPTTGDIVADHELVAPGESSVLDAH